MYPKKFQDLIDMFERLPGVGSKTAGRFAFSLLDEDKDKINSYIETLNGLLEIKRCEICGFLSDDDKCPICKDLNRDKSTIMVVAYPQDVVAIEKTDSYHGYYHVLGGVISPSKGIYPEDINIDKLLDRINDDIKEVIVATSPTMDGEMTALYLDKLLNEKGILVTRIAHGLPMGSALDYADDLTLIKALSNRRKIQE